MFITSKRRGYTRDRQQVASGLFLILMQPHYSSEKYPTMTATCVDCGRDRTAHEESQRVTIPVCDEHGVMARLRKRAEAKQEPKDSDFNKFPASARLGLGCAQCDAHALALQKAGCTFFHPGSITYQIRALVRFVSMEQFGHFMMGHARVHGHKITLSGSYGSDGLPDSVPDAVYEIGVPLPQELYDAWKNGGGWNGAGSEGPAMREWALAHLKELRA
jgi:hypothetical protein